jgi:hypothetical protein
MSAREPIISYALLLEMSVELRRIRIAVEQRQGARAGI